MEANSKILKEKIQVRIETFFSYKEDFPFPVNFQCVDVLRKMNESIDVCKFSVKKLQKIEETLNLFLALMENYISLVKEHKTQKGDEKNVNDCIDIFEDFIIGLNVPEMKSRENFEKSVKDFKSFLAK